MPGLQTCFATGAAMLQDLGLAASLLACTPGHAGAPTLAETLCLMACLLRVRCIIFEKYGCAMDAMLSAE